MLHRAMIVVAVYFASALTSVSSLAAPRIILITGLDLKNPVILADWYENAEIMLGLEIADVPSQRLRHREYFEVAMFWGPRWQEYVDGGESLSALTPADANQHARLYPSTGQEPVVLVYDDRPDPSGYGVRRSGLARRVNSRVVELFIKRGVALKRASQCP
jgi:hypothetical protein